MPPAHAFNEDWEQAALGVYQPTEGITLIQGDAGTWILGDTVSNYPTDCGPVRNSAEVIPWNGGHALRLNSVDAGSGCADNLFLFIQDAQQIGRNQGFGIPLSPGTVLSFEETGSLIAPRYFPNRSKCVTPPCYGAVTLFVQDELNNTLAYVMQRAEQAVPQDRFGSYREIFLDPAAGRYSRNIYEDFSTLADFRPQAARITHVGLEVNDPGTAVFDKLSIGGGSPIAGVTKATRVCAASQLQAGGRLCQADFLCRSEYVAKAARDPNETGFSACREAAIGRFRAAYGQAVAKGQGACVLNDSGDAVAADLLSGIQPIRAGIEAGWIPGSRTDSQLRSTLLSAAGTMCADVLQAESTNAKKPNARKLAAGEAAAARKFLLRAKKALKKSRSIPYIGDSPATISSRVENLTGAYSAKTGPGR